MNVHLVKFDACIVAKQDTRRNRLRGLLTVSLLKRAFTLLHLCQKEDSLYHILVSGIRI